MEIINLEAIFEIYDIEMIERPLKFSGLFYMPENTASAAKYLQKELSSRIVLIVMANHTPF
jgi:hypothetical protein